MQTSSNTGPDDTGVQGAPSVSSGSVTPEFVLVENLNHLLRRAHARADQLFTEVMEGLDVTPRQSALLHGVKRCHGASISALTRTTGIDRGTLSEMVPRLVKRGLLRQTRSVEDGRAMALSLTEAGLAKVQEVEERTPQLRRELLSTLPPEYHDLFAKMLLLLVGIESEVRIRNSHENDHEERR